MFGQCIVSSIKPLDLEAYQHKREQEGRAPATIDMEISIAKTMVTKAFDNDLVDGRTVKAFRRVKRKLKKAGNARKQTLSVGDYVKLCQAAPPHLKALLTVAYHTGMRLGELRQLKWTNIDRDNGFIRLSADLTKEGKAKVIPINAHVKRILAELPRALAHDFVFTYHGKPITAPSGCKKALKTACKATGVAFGRNAKGRGLTFHDIRRTVKTNMLSASVDKIHRDLILGHSLQGMDAHYIAPSETDLQEAMSKYTGWLEAQIANLDQILDHNAKKG